MKALPAWFAVLATLWLAIAPRVSAQVKAGEQLTPELGIYVPIDEEKWGAAEVNLRIVNNNFQLFFLDGQGKLVEPPEVKVIVHYGNFVKKSQNELTVLLKREGMMMTSPRVISPPHRYRVRIFLSKTEEPENAYGKPVEEKEFIGMHILNQLGGDYYDKTRMEASSTPVEEEVEELAEEGAPAAAAQALTDEENRPVE